MQQTLVPVSVSLNVGRHGGQYRKGRTTGRTKVPVINSIEVNFTLVSKKEFLCITYWYLLHQAPRQKKSKLLTLHSWCVDTQNMLSIVLNE